MFRALICPSSGARGYTCVIAAYGVWCLGCWDEGSCSSNFPHTGHIACCPAPNSRPPATKALHTICVNNTSIVLSSWWWAYECPKHVERIISAIKHSVASRPMSHATIKQLQTLIFIYITIIGRGGQSLKKNSFKHAAWSKDSILCFWRRHIVCNYHRTGRCQGNVTSLYRSRSCADVLRGERADVTDFFSFLVTLVDEVRGQA